MTSERQLAVIQLKARSRHDFKRESEAGLRIGNLKFRVVVSGFVRPKDILITLPLREPVSDVMADTVIALQVFAIFPR